LIIRTPQGNLAYGMKWLQSIFANRYHRFRKGFAKGSVRINRYL
jgi:hypothetical protein